MKMEKKDPKDSYEKMDKSKPKDKKKHEAMEGKMDLEKEAVHEKYKKMKK